MTEWKLVRVGVLDEVTIKAGCDAMAKEIKDSDGTEIYPTSIYDAMVAASPAYTITDEDVERARSACVKLTGPCGPDEWIRAALTAFMEGR